MTAAATKIDALIDYLRSTDAEKEAELTEMGRMESMTGEEFETVDDAVEYWMGEDPAMLPSWSHLTVVAEEEQQWLVHITRSREIAEQIIKEGFLGIDSLRHVATSTAHRSTQPKSKDGFAFAFRLADLESGEVENPGWFGSVAIKFRAPSLRVASSFDDEEQSIFVASTATEIQITEL